MDRATTQDSQIMFLSRVLLRVQVDEQPFRQTTTQVKTMILPPQLLRQIRVHIETTMQIKIIQKNNRNKMKLNF